MRTGIREDAGFFKFIGNSYELKMLRKDAHANAEEIGKHDIDDFDLILHLPYIEQYDKAYTKLETFHKKFPVDMKKSILQLAMQGKLVEQREEEGNAEELYEQIMSEKARMMKEGNIKEFQSDVILKKEMF